MSRWFQDQLRKSEDARAVFAEANEQLRRFAYHVLAEAHQVIWEVDEIQPAQTAQDKKRASQVLQIEGAPSVPRDIYDGLVRDAMQWRAKQTPQPQVFPPNIFRMVRAVLPFVQIVEGTSGRIPVERLAGANWHELCKAFADLDPVFKEESRVVVDAKVFDQAHGLRDDK